MKDLLKNLFIKNFLFNTGKYTTHEEAIIISCYFNPQQSIYRLDAFRKFYASIKHMNHYILECAIGDSEYQLPDDPGIFRVRTESLLWHKESLLNKIVKSLPSKYKYIFWVDADVIFTNQDWMNDAVAELQNNNIVQLFEYCVHLEKGETTPSFIEHLDDYWKPRSCDVKNKHPKVWKSFGANYAQGNELYKSDVYDEHGHVGFAWGAKRELLDTVPLYDKALVGGADHIIAHAAVGQIPCSCISKSFTDDLEDVNSWSKLFYLHAEGKLGYVKGDVYHLWHGEIQNREYLKRIKEFTPQAKEILEKDENGLFVNKNPNTKKYVDDYFHRREEVNTMNSGGGGYYNNSDPLLSAVVAYSTDSVLLGTLAGGSLPGAIIGEMLNDNEKNVEVGGSGASGTWEDSNTKIDLDNSNQITNDSTSVDLNQNFS